MEFNKVPPHDLEAEQAVLGCMLTDKDAVISAVETLTEDDFYREDNKIIYKAILNLYNRAEPIDIITLKSELSAIGKFEAVGGLEYLAELPDKVPTTSNVERYIKIVEEKSTLRTLIKTANDLISLGYDPTQDVEDIMDSAEKKIFNVMQKRNQTGYSSIKDILVDSFTELEDLYNRKQHVTGVPTGFIDLDNKTAGLHNSDLILVAARPAMGKSAFALNIATNAAMRGNTPVAIFSLEMSKLQLVNRIISMESKVDSKNIRTGNLSPAEWSNIAEGASNVGMSHIIIEDTPGISVAELRSKCRKFKRDNNLGLIIIDYIQLMSGGGKSESRQQEVSEISRALKGVARELNVPVIALSQLSRSVESRPDKRPMLSDLRESGAIEQDADVVMFIYREDYYKKDTDRPGVAEIIIAKQRNGPTGTVELGWIADLTKFVNLEQSNKRNEDF